MKNWFINNKHFLGFILVMAAIFVLIGGTWNLKSETKTVQAAQAPAEDCELYRDRALKVLEQIETTGEASSNRNLMIAIQYLGRAQKASIEYQSCLAQSKR